MIRFISYIGPKEQAQVTLGLGNKVEFPKGIPIDVTGINERKVKELLRTGLFKVHASSEPVPLDVPKIEPAPNKCPKCGFLAKNKAGLVAHLRFCKV
jgi:hypothetical protein